MAKTNATANTETDSGPKRFNLHKPYEFRGVRYDNLMAREPKVRDLRIFLKGAENDSIAAGGSVLANLCNVDEPVIADMSIKDYGIMKA